MAQWGETWLKGGKSLLNRARHGSVGRPWLKRDEERLFNCIVVVLHKNYDVKSNKIERGRLDIVKHITS